MNRLLPGSKGFLMSLACVSLVLTGCFESSSEPEEEQEEEVGGGTSKGARPDKDAIREELTELRAKKKTLDEQLRGIQKDLSKKSDLVATELEVVETLGQTKAYVAGLDSLDAALDTNLKAWREATRRSFIGVKIPEIVTVKGDKFTDVAIAGVTDNELMIQHAGGQATLLILDLPVSLRKNLLHEPTVLSELKPQ